MTLLAGKKDTAGLAEARDVKVELMILCLRLLRVVLNVVLGVRVTRLTEGRLGGVSAVRKIKLRKEKVG